MTTCKHEWEDRTEVLKDVFGASRSDSVFYACNKCLRINEASSRDVVEHRPLRLVEAA